MISEKLKLKEKNINTTEEMVRRLIQKRNSAMCTKNSKKNSTSTNFTLKKTPNTFR